MPGPMSLAQQLPSAHCTSSPEVGLRYTEANKHGHALQTFSLAGKTTATNVEATGPAHNIPALAPSGQGAGLHDPTRWELSGSVSCFGQAGPAQKEASGERKRVCLARVEARAWGAQQVQTQLKKGSESTGQGQAAGWALGDGFSGLCSNPSGYSVLGRGQGAGGRSWVPGVGVLQSRPPLPLLPSLHRHSVYPLFTFSKLSISAGIHCPGPDNKHRAKQSNAFQIPLDASLEICPDTCLGRVRR